MNNYSFYNRGYIGLIALLIVVAIISFIMFKQYERLGIIKTTEKESVTPSEITPDFKTPIERAQNIKDVLESRDRNMLNQ